MNVEPGENGRTLLKCHAGCDTERVLKAARRRNAHAKTHVRVSADLARREHQVRQSAAWTCLHPNYGDTYGHLFRETSIAAMGRLDARMAAVEAAKLALPDDDGDGTPLPKHVM